jgi:DNA-binding transcriptional LysR family regulator
MRLRHIEVLRAIMVTGSVSGAGDLLHVSQPVVSRTLGHAEQQAGYKFFDRVRGRLVPTAELLAIYPEVEQVFAAIEKLRYISSTVRRKGGAPLRIAVTPSLASSVLPRAIERMVAADPDAAFELATLHTSEVVTALRSGAVDLGICLSPPAVAGIAEHVLSSGQMVLATPPRWPPLVRHNAPLSELGYLADKQFICLHDGTPLGSVIGQRLQHARIGLQANIVVQTYGIARSLVSQGVGYALLDTFTAVAGGPGGLKVYQLSPGLEFDVKLLGTTETLAGRLATLLKESVALAAGELRSALGAIASEHHISLA